jgi:hypothetical protein
LPFGSSTFSRSRWMTTDPNVQFDVLNACVGHHSVAAQH